MTVRTPSERYKAACHAVMKAAWEKPNHSGLQYAASYAKAGLALMDVESMKVQCLYILSNIGAWRGEEAKAVRAELKELSK